MDRFRGQTSKATLSVQSRGDEVSFFRILGQSFVKPAEFELSSPFTMLQKVKANMLAQGFSGIGFWGTHYKWNIFGIS
jgi:hypothetical protein